MVQTCPGCGNGSYVNLHNIYYATHRRYCPGVLYQAVGDVTRPTAEHINNNNSNNNGYSNPPIYQVLLDATGNPITSCGLLQAHINNNGKAQP